MRVVTTQQSDHVKPEHGMRATSEKRDRIVEKTCCDSDSGIEKTFCEGNSGTGKTVELADRVVVRLTHEIVVVLVVVAAGVVLLRLTTERLGSTTTFACESRMLSEHSYESKRPGVSRLSTLSLDVSTRKPTRRL